MATRNLFTLLTLAFAAIVLLPVMIRRPLAGALRVTLHAVFIALYLGGTIVLAGAANQGGRLVHERGVRSVVNEPVPQAALAPAGTAKSPGQRPGS